MEDLKKELEKVEDSIFMLEMKDKWTKDDNARMDALNERKAELEKAIKEGEGYGV